MNGVMGILLALHERSRSGKGQCIDISMTDGLTGLLHLPLFLSHRAGSWTERSNNLLSHRYGCYNTYESSDGKFLAIGAVENRFWKRLCEILEVAEYGDLQYDDDRRQEIIDRFRLIFKGRTIEEWDALLGNEDVCYSRILSPCEALGQELFQARQIVTEIKDRDEFSAQLGIPIKLSRTPGTHRTDPVGFGGSNDNILQELGYSAAQIESFKTKRIV